MSDVNLLMFGCGVTFIAVSGAYIRVRRFFTSEQVKVRTGGSPDPIAARNGRSFD